MSTNHVPRVVAEPSCGVARHGGNATVPVCADTAMHARTESQNTEGGAVWAEHLRWAALESGSFFSGPSRASTDLARRARVPAGSSTPHPFDDGRISPQAVTAPWQEVEKQRPLEHAG